MVGQKTKRINNMKGDIVVRYFSDRMLKLIKKNQPIRIQVGGTIVEMRSRNEKNLRKISMLQAEINRLKKESK